MIIELSKGRKAIGEEPVGGRVLLNVKSASWRFGNLYLDLEGDKRINPDTVDGHIYFDGLWYSDVDWPIEGEGRVPKPEDFHTDEVRVLTEWGKECAWDPYELALELGVEYDSVDSEGDHTIYRREA